MREPSSDLSTDPSLNLPGGGLKNNKNDMPGMPSGKNEMDCLLSDTEKRQGENHLPITLPHLSQPSPAGFRGAIHQGGNKARDQALEASAELFDFPKTNR